MEGNLDGLTVIDVSQNLSGPYCTMFLADLGATVIKIEPPAGDNARSFGPPFVDGESSGFMSLNRNKKSVVIDLKSPDGLDVILRLIESADVFVENSRPGSMERLGLGYDRLQELNRELIYCSISGFGLSGPWADRPGLDLVAQGMSGIMSVTGNPGDDPVKVGVPITDLAAGLILTIGILSAIHRRASTGMGELVSTSLLESALSLSVWEASSALASGTRPGPMGTAHRLAAPYELFETRDGYITIGAASDALWARLCEALGLQELLSDPRFKSNTDRVANRRELAQLIGDVTRRFPTDRLEQILLETGVPCGKLLGYDEVLKHPHVIARQMVEELDHSSAGEVSVLGIPLEFGGRKPPLRTSAPALGEHTEEVLRAAGYSGADIQRLIDSNTIETFPSGESA